MAAGETPTPTEPNPNEMWGENLLEAQVNFEKGVYQNGEVADQSKHNIFMGKLYASRVINRIISGSLETAEGLDNDDSKVSLCFWSKLQELGSSEDGSTSLEKDGLAELKEYLAFFGILKKQPTVDEINAGVETAKTKVTEGTDEEFLKSLAYINFAQQKELLGDPKGGGKPVAKLYWGGVGNLYVDSNKIEGGVDGDSDWTCGNRGPKTYETAKGTLVDGKSIDAIREYAANRPTQLPRIETNALCMVITPGGPKLFVEYGVHRVAAAKLRGGEPLAFTSMKIFAAESGATNNG